MVSQQKVWLLSESSDLKYYRSSFSDLSRIFHCNPLATVSLQAETRFYCGIRWFVLFLCASSLLVTGSSLPGEMRASSQAEVDRTTSEDAAATTASTELSVGDAPSSDYFLLPSRVELASLTCCTLLDYRICANVSSPLMNEMTTRTFGPHALPISGSPTLFVLGILLRP